MPGTRRTPINRQHKPPVSELAVRLFMKMQRHEWMSDRWWELEHQLRHEVRAKLWDYPCVEDPRQGNPEKVGTYNHEHWRPNETARALWRVLDAGARELRRRDREARRAKATPPSPPPEQPPSAAL